MITENYNKLHVLNEELKKIETAEKLVKKANETLQLELATFTDVSEQLSTTQQIMITSLREYMKNVIDIRMSYGREVVHMIESSRELNVITKGTGDIDKACLALIKLGEVLNDDLISKIKKTFNMGNK
jgi:hypothetical protein